MSEKQEFGKCCCIYRDFSLSLRSGKKIKNKTMPRYNLPRRQWRSCVELHLHNNAHAERSLSKSCEAREVRYRTKNARKERSISANFHYLLGQYHLVRDRSLWRRTCSRVVGASCTIIMTTQWVPSPFLSLIFRCLLVFLYLNSLLIRP